jgi:hypothetical protein
MFSPPHPLGFLSYNQLHSFGHTMSDSSLAPPLRIQPQGSEYLSIKKARKQIERFVGDFTTRVSGSGGAGGDPAVAAQLEKLAKALAEEG